MSLCSLPASAVFSLASRCPGRDLPESQGKASVAAQEPVAGGTHVAYDALAWFHRMRSKRRVPTFPLHFPKSASIGAAGWVALMIASGQVGAAGDTPAEPKGPACADAIALSGEREAVEQLREALRSGALAHRSSRSCATARVSIAAQGDAWLVALTYAGSNVHRTVSKIPFGAVWIEAWLLPALSGPANEDRDEPANPDAPNGAAMETQGPPAPVDQPTATTAPPAIIHRSPRVWVGLIPNGVVSDDGALGAGTDLAVKVWLGEPTWLGARLGGVWDTRLSGPASDQAGVFRYELQASFRGGIRARTGETSEWLFGVGFGLGAGTSGKHVGGDIEDREEGGPLAEGCVELHTGIGQRLQLITSMGVRWHPLRAGSPDTGSPEQAALPNPINTLSASLGIGMGYDLAGSP